jgi:hypothetical protein
MTVRDGDLKAGNGVRRIQLTVGSFSFTGQFETQAAPNAVRWLAGRLPLHGIGLHARWSGEAGWAPLGVEVRLDPENATTYPHPGQVLLYAGLKSEPELLIPYGACAFACRAGTLAGSHVITLTSNISSLRTMGETLLRGGAQALLLTALDE